MHASFADNKDGHTNQGEVLTCARPSGLPQAVMAFVPGGTTDLHLQWASKGGGDAQPDGRHPTQGQIPVAPGTRCCVRMGMQSQKQM